MKNKIADKKKNVKNQGALSLSAASPVKSDSLTGNACWNCGHYSATERKKSPCDMCIRASEYQIDCWKRIGGKNGK